MNFKGYKTGDTRSCTKCHEKFTISNSLKYRCAKCKAPVQAKWNKTYRAKTGNAYSKLNSFDVKSYIQHRIAAWKKWSKIKCQVTSNLTVQYLVDLYQNQNGLCYYTQEQLKFLQRKGKVTKNSLSLDRLTPKDGYVQGNVVWCQNIINTMKGNLTENEFYSLIEQILENNDFKRSP